MTKEILILSDSFATCLGCFDGNFVDFIARDYGFNEQINIINPSTFNMTSADALTYIRQQVGEKPLDCVIIALGNCDSCGFGVPKKRSFLRPGKPFRKTVHARNKYPILQRNKPFYFTSKGSPPKQPRVVSPGDFKKNLRDIIRIAQKATASVIVCNLKGNDLFPPDNNTGNFSFYKLFGVPTHFEYSGNGHSRPVLKALHLHDTGQLKAAAQTYETLLGSGDQETMSLALNNMAALHFDNSEYEEALAKLEKIPLKGNAMAATVLYNKSKAYSKINEQDKSDACLEAARTRDFGTYRIGDDYRTAAQQAGNRKQVKFLDLDEFITPTSFTDYCHPDRHTHATIAKEIVKTICSQINVGKGEHKPVVKYIPINPDCSAGFESDFFWHFKIATEPDALAATAIATAKDSYDSILKTAFRFVRDPKLTPYYTILSHPLFGSESYLQQVHPIRRTDVGRVPELFFMKNMLPIYKAMSQGKINTKWEIEILEFLPSYGKLHQWLGAARIPAEPSSLEKTRKDHDNVDWLDVAARSRKMLGRLSQGEPEVGNKVRSITYWFMREAIIFGSVSTPLMLCNRMHILKLVETLAYFFAFATEASPAYEQMCGLKKDTARLIAVHKGFLEARANAYDYPQAWLDEYRMELAAL